MMNVVLTIATTGNALAFNTKEVVNTTRIVVVVPVAPANVTLQVPVPCLAQPQTTAVQLTVTVVLALSASVQVGESGKHVGLHSTLLDTLACLVLTVRAVHVSTPDAHAIHSLLIGLQLVLTVLLMLIVAKEVAKGGCANCNQGMRHAPMDGIVSQGCVIATAPVVAM
eukprot:TRINITY_DN21078_c0_g1_i1.p3 TRINITY_DN21078_c0_g1~~TRINITY_DN21078_c0_g1_i1.p3  ORF type:complete len:168 (-),score=3.09 TRINITY_DN21078_c0_g1_i1:201-704(-)